MFVYGTCAIVERRRIYFDSNMFPDDLGDVISTGAPVTNMHMAGPTPPNIIRTSRNTESDPTPVTVTSDDTDSVADDCDLTHPTPVIATSDDTASTPAPKETEHS